MPVGGVLECEQGSAGAYIVYLIKLPTFGDVGLVTFGFQVTTVVVCESFLFRIRGARTRYALGELTCKSSA